MNKKSYSNIEVDLEEHGRTCIELEKLAISPKHDWTERRHRDLIIQNKNNKTTHFSAKTFISTN